MKLTLANGETKFVDSAEHIMVVLPNSNEFEIDRAWSHAKVGNKFVYFENEQYVNSEIVAVN